MRTALFIGLISGGIFLLQGGGVIASVLENEWLRVEIDAEASGDVLSWVSRENGRHHLRPAEKETVADPLLGGVSGSGSAVRGLVNRFETSTGNLRGSDLAPWKTLEESPSRLRLESADGSVRLTYELPADHAALHKAVTIRNNGNAPIRFSSIANLQVGGDYRILTEPTSDYIIAPQGEQVTIQEAQSGMETTFSPSQDWVAVVDRNKDHLIGAVMSGTEATVQSVNELDQESLVLTLSFPPVPSGAEETRESYWIYASGFSRVSYLSPEVVLSLEVGTESGPEAVVAPLRMVPESRLTLESASGEPVEVALSRAGASLPYRSRLPASESYFLRVGSSAVPIHPYAIENP